LLLQLHVVILLNLQALVETAMLSAVSGLAFLLSTLLKLDNSLGYFLPLPIAIAACRSGVAAAWWTMVATAFLLLGEQVQVSSQCFLSRSKLFST
jgi:hypothetical protein